MAETTYKVGDQVQLKSGGPVMTVDMLIPKTQYKGPQLRCKWFNGKKPEQQDFDVESVKGAGSD